MLPSPQLVTGGCVNFSWFHSGHCTKVLVLSARVSLVHLYQGVSRMGPAFWGSATHSPALWPLAQVPHTALHCDLSHRLPHTALHCDLSPGCHTQPCTACGLSHRQLERGHYSRRHRLFEQLLTCMSVRACTHGLRKTISFLGWKRGERKTMGQWLEGNLYRFPHFRAENSLQEK